MRFNWSYRGCTYAGFRGCFRGWRRASLGAALCCGAVAVLRVLTVMGIAATGFLADVWRCCLRRFDNGFKFAMNDIMLIKDLLHCIGRGQLDFCVARHFGGLFPG